MTDVISCFQLCWPDYDEELLLCYCVAHRKLSGFLPPDVTVTK